MIAAIWSARGVDAEAAIVTRLAQAVSCDATCHRSRAGTIAAFLAMPGASFDGEAAEAIVGLRDAWLSARGASLTIGRAAPVGRCMYIARSEDLLVACSRFAPLVAALPAVPPIDADRLAALSIAELNSFRDRGVRRGIRRVLPGELLVATGGRWVAVHERARAIPTRAPSGDDSAASLFVALREAVTRAISGRHAVAVLAGGGLDSSALLAVTVAIARGAAKKDVDAIALDFAGEGDDRPYLRALEAELGIVPLRLSPEDCAAEVRSSLVLDGAPYTWPTGGWEVTMAKRARERGAEIVLTGMGGDDVLGGTSPADPLRLVRWRRRAAEKMPHAVRAAWRSWCAARAGTSVPWAGPRMRAMFANVDSAREPRDDFARLSQSGAALEMAEMRSQVESVTGVLRVDPYLDSAFVTFVAGLAPGMLSFGGQSRGLLRHAMSGILPEALRVRSGKAAFEPAALRMLAPLGGLASLRDLADAHALADLGIVEPAPLRLAFERFAKSPDDHAEWLRVWPALACEAFARGT